MLVTQVLMSIPTRFPGGRPQSLRVIRLAKDGHRGDVLRCLRGTPSLRLLSEVLQNAKLMSVRLDRKESRDY